MKTYGKDAGMLQTRTLSQCDCTPLSTAPNTARASQHNISTITAAGKNTADWTKGTVGDFVLLVVTGTPMLGLCMPWFVTSR